MVLLKSAIRGLSSQQHPEKSLTAAVVFVYSVLVALWPHTNTLQTCLTSFFGRTLDCKSWYVLMTHIDNVMMSISSYHDRVVFVLKLFCMYFAQCTMSLMGIFSFT